jgi:hypothetical protein
MEFSGIHERFLRRLWEVHQVQRSGQALVDEVGKRWLETTPLLTPEQRHYGELALQQAGEWLDGVAIRCGCMHGDFAPGNTLVQADGELFVCDWELTEFDQPNLWDILSFHAVAAVIRRKPKLILDWDRLGSGDMQVDKGLLRIYLVASLCTLLKEGSAGRERAIVYRHKWLRDALAGKIP